MRRLRILQVHDKPGPGGGIAAHVSAVREILHELGHEAFELALVDDPERAPPGTPTLPRTYDPIRGRMHRRRLLRGIGQLQPDLIMCHAGFTAIAAPVLTAIVKTWPVIATLHDVAPFCFKGTRIGLDRDVCSRRANLSCIWSGCAVSGEIAGLPRALAHHVVKTGLAKAWARAHHVIVPSRYMRDLALQHGFSPTSLTVISPFARPTPAPIASTSDTPLILYVGALTRTKGVDIFVDALAHIKHLNWRAALVGDGDLRDLLFRQARAHALETRIEFAGRRDTAGVNAFRQRSAFAVFPSIQPESFGLAGLESLAWGRPVVGFAIGGVNDWLRHEVTGIDVDDRTARGLSKALARMLLQTSLAPRLGLNAHRVARLEFSREEFARQLDTVIAQSIPFAGTVRIHAPVADPYDR